MSAGGTSGGGVNLRAHAPSQHSAGPSPRLQKMQIDAMLARAHFEYQRERFDKAKALAQYLVTVFADDSGAKILAICAHKLGDEDTASKYYPQALNAFPTDLYVVVGYAELLLDKHQFSEAADLLRRAIELDPAAQHPAGARARVLILKATA